LVVDAQNDVRGFVSPVSAGATPGMMVVMPNRVGTLVFSAQDSLLSVINNSSGSSVATATLPGFTESFVVSPDSQVAYAAVPTAFVSGQPPGVVKVVSLSTGAFTAEIDIPGVRYLSISHNGNRILAFSTGPDSVANTVAVITQASGTGNPTVTFIPGFDHPVSAFFSSDDNTAYVVNCGLECGGAQASVQKLDLTTNTPDAPVFVPAASVAVVNSTTMYLAGTPFNPDGTPAQPCTGQTTKATSCGLLTVFDLPTMKKKNSDNIVITDGYHNRMALGANGQLFVGAHTCTEIIAVNTGDEVRGCLSIYNTQTGAVVIPPDNGDVTGIQPVGSRNVVYLVQNGELRIYDTTTDKLQTKQIDINGVAVDVKTLDF
jgi:WD40 repeat protein